MRLIHINKNLSQKDVTLKYMTVIVLLSLLSLFLSITVISQDLITKNKMYRLEIEVAFHKTKQPINVFVEGDSIETFDDIELSDSSILQELINQKCVLPNVALAQFKIESGHFKSLICYENKNLAGIRNSRSPFVIGKNRDHCVYATYRDCIKDYILIQNRYLQKINNAYAEDGGYIGKVTQVR
jgi:hypothetical protein